MPLTKLPASPPKLAARAALALHKALTRAAERVVPPQLALMMQVAGFWRTQLLHVAAKYRIADRLAASPKTSAALAAEIGANHDALHRTLRALATIGVFEIDEEGRFRNNRLSETMKSDVVASMRDAAEYFGSASNLQAWADFDATVMTGKGAFNRVHGKSVWDYFSAHPDEETTFAGTMTSLTEQDATSLASAYDFGQHPVLCDVAGSKGTLLAEILTQYPKIRGILFDQPAVLAHAATYLKERGVHERVTCEAGSFFERVPANADAYLLKDVLHDWDDARCKAILEHVRRAMSPSSRLLICEIPVEPSCVDIPGPLVDIQMLAVTDGGRQRSRAEFSSLFTACGLRLVRVHETSLPIAIVEAAIS